MNRCIVGVSVSCAWAVAPRAKGMTACAISATASARRNMPASGQIRTALVLPGAALHVCDEALHGVVEELRLLQVDGVAALREDHQPAVGDALLHQKRRRDARRVLVAHQ